MLSIRMPDDELIAAVRELIRQGNSARVLTELSRITPEKWEISISCREPLPRCYAWFFNAAQPDGSEVFVVFRRKSPLIEKARRRSQRRRGQRAPA